MLTYGQFIAVLFFGLANFITGIYIAVNDKCVKITQKGGANENGSKRSKVKSNPQV